MQPRLMVLLGVLLVPTVGLVGDVVTDGKLISTTVSGPPLEVASATVVAGLNADRVDGFDGDAFALTSDTYTKAEVEALVAAAATADSRRLFYLTTTYHNGAGADEACDSGFHMASVWEIVDPSNLRYDTARGTVFADSGNGPPQYVEGWIRTGDVPWTPPDVGLANCSGWSSAVAIDDGTWVYLPDPVATDWNSPATRISPWEAGTAQCDLTFSVWCVED